MASNRKRKRDRSRRFQSTEAASARNRAAPPGGFWKVGVLLLAVSLAAFVWWSSGNSPSRPGGTSPAAPETSSPAIAESAAVAKRSAVADGAAGVLTPAAVAKRTAVAHALDPDQDGWHTETLSEQCLSHLKQLTRGWSSNSFSAEAGPLQNALAAEFWCSPLRPAALNEVYRGASIRVLRAATGDKPSGDELRLQGAAGLAEAFRSLGEALVEQGNSEVEIKIIDIQQRNESEVNAEAILHVSSIGSDGSAQVNAKWNCTWQVEAGHPLKLRSIVVTEYEEIAVDSPHGTWFADCTLAVLGKNDSFHRQLAFGLNHWLRRIESIHVMTNFSYCGMAVGDVNGDGNDDLYLCQPGGLPNRLFLQQDDGTAVDASAAAGVDVLDNSRSALLVDLDNDGDQDLVVATLYVTLVYENDGTGKFAMSSSLRNPHTDVKSLSAADYDNDGDLDLYLCVEFHSDPSQQPSSPFVYHDANDGAPNVLYRNDIAASGADWQFTDATAECGLDVNNRRHSLAAAWEDYDNDGDADLYVANDYGRNCLYRNDQGSFVDVAQQAGVVDYGSGMSVSWADYDRNGHMDLYVGNMFSAAGNRITRQTGFQPLAEEQARELYPRFAKGNTLFRNGGQGQFVDVGAEAAVEMGRWAWSSLFADINNDGWDDLLVANGYLTGDDTSDL